MKLYTTRELNYPAEKNMQRDRELLELSVNLNAPILRIYSWDKPTITLGKMQKTEEVLNTAFCKQEAVYFCSRPTGGRAVYHIDDLTYSFVFPISLKKEFGATVSQTYKIIAESLSCGLAKVEIKTELSTREVNREAAKKEAKLPCFTAPAKQEILVNFKKLIGSAQLRTKTGVLQHGSIPLSSKFRELPLYENCNVEEQQKRMRELCSGAISLDEITDKHMRLETISEAIITGFSEQLNLRTKPLPLYLKKSI
jgi:lipoate-protein ligase A